MILVYVAICAAHIAVADCNRDTALDWIVAPERQSHPVACMIHGQQYAAASRLVSEGTYPKVFCRLPGGNGNVG
jgi:hypothetical protein